MVFPSSYISIDTCYSVCCRSPIIPARPTYSAEMLNMSMNGDLESTNVWVNPLNGSLTNTLGGSTNSTLPGPRFKVSRGTYIDTQQCDLYWMPSRDALFASILTPLGHRKHGILKLNYACFIETKVLVIRCDREGVILFKCINKK